MNYVSPYLLNASPRKPSNQAASKNPFDVIGDDTLSLVDKAAILNKLEARARIALNLILKDDLAMTPDASSPLSDLEDIRKARSFLAGLKRD